MSTTIEPMQTGAFTTAGEDAFRYFQIETKPCAFSSGNPPDLEIPNSFWKGISDCESGRVVDMERAIDETPPETPPDEP